MANRSFKIILVLALAGIAFGLSFGLSWWTGRGAAPKAATGAEVKKAAASRDGTPTLPPLPEAVPSVDEKHLYDLIKEVRDKTEECRKRELALVQQEQRLQMTKDLLTKQTQELEALRLQVNTAVTRLKDVQADLDKNRIAIAADETKNLKRTAAVYDRMEPAAGSQILQSMCTNNQSPDAVKILYYMSERSVAKLLAEMPDKKLAASLVEQLKHVKEQG